MCLKIFMIKKLKDRNKKKSMCLIHSLPSWICCCIIISGDPNVGNFTMGVFTVWLQQREKFDGLFLESGAVSASKKSDVEMNTTDSLLSEAARWAHQTFWETLGLVLPMQLGTNLCNMGKTHLFLQFCSVSRGPRWWDLLVPPIQGYSWITWPSHISPASCL